MPLTICDVHRLSTSRVPPVYDTSTVCSASVSALSTKRLTSQCSLGQGWRAWTGRELKTCRAEILRQWRPA